MSEKADNQESGPNYKKIGVGLAVLAGAAIAGILIYVKTSSKSDQGSQQEAGSSEPGSTGETAPDTSGAAKVDANAELLRMQSIARDEKTAIDAATNVEDQKKIAESVLATAIESAKATDMTAVKEGIEKLGSTLANAKVSAQTAAIAAESAGTDAAKQAAAKASETVATIAALMSKLREVINQTIASIEQSIVDMVGKITTQMDIATSSLSKTEQAAAANNVVEAKKSAEMAAIAANTASELAAGARKLADEIGTDKASLAASNVESYASKTVNAANRATDLYNETSKRVSVAEQNAAEAATKAADFEKIAIEQSKIALVNAAAKTAALASGAASAAVAAAEGARSLAATARESAKINTSTAAFSAQAATASSDNASRAAGEALKAAGAAVAAAEQLASEAASAASQIRTTALQAKDSATAARAKPDVPGTKSAADALAGFSQKADGYAAVAKEMAAQAGSAPANEASSIAVAVAFDVAKMAEEAKRLVEEATAEVAERLKPGYWYGINCHTDKTAIPTWVDAGGIGRPPQGDLACWEPCGVYASLPEADKKMFDANRQRMYGTLCKSSVTNKPVTPNGAMMRADISPLRYFLLDTKQRHDAQISLPAPLSIKYSYVNDAGVESDLSTTTFVEAGQGQDIGTPTYTSQAGTPSVVYTKISFPVGDGTTMDSNSGYTMKRQIVKTNIYVAQGTTVFTKQATIEGNGGTFDVKIPNVTSVVARYVSDADAAFLTGIGQGIADSGFAIAPMGPILSDGCMLM